MEVFSLILVVSVCWTRTWKAAIADSIIHIGKGVLRLPVPLDTFSALLCNLLCVGRLPPPRSPRFLSSLSRWLCCSLHSRNCFPQGSRASSFPPSAVREAFFPAGYVCALDLEVPRGYRSGVRGSWTLPRSRRPLTLSPSCPGPTANIRSPPSPTARRRSEAPPPALLSLGGTGGLAT